MEEDLFARLGRAWERRNEGAAARIFTVPVDVKYLDTGQLATLEKALRDWAAKAKRKDVRASRRRILLLFLLLRHSGARLGEACALDPARDYRPEAGSLMLGQGAARRTVPLPEAVGKELRKAMDDGLLDAPGKGAGSRPLCVDQAHLRRKLYERAGECGLPKELANPTVIRRSRGIELLRENVPLPVVQRLLGHSTPSLAGDYLDFSDKDMDATVRRVMDRESRRTSARNSFFGHVVSIRRGDIQTEIRMVSVGGHEITAFITNTSLERLDLRKGGFVTAEVKAPWVIVTADDPGRTGAANRLPATLARIEKGKLTSEVILRLSDGLEVCSIITEESRRRLALKKGDPAWVIFNAFSVILNAE